MTTFQILSPTNHIATFISMFMTILLLLLSFQSFIIFISASSSQPLAPALYVFGDSLFDSGNNNILPTLAKANYLPYGVNFGDHGKKPTGRFTNGKTVADFIAENLGLPFAPPYVDLLRGPADLTGLNYASGSCGILPETGNDYGKCLNIKDQVTLFELTSRIELRLKFKSSKKLAQYLSKSIFIISIGNNDYINNYLDSSSSSSKNYTPKSFAQLLLDRLAGQFEKLYKLGARKVLMFELGPIGCLPTVTRKRNGGTQCVEEVNELISHFNNGLGPMLNNLTLNLQDSVFALGHANWLGYDAIQNPSKYGLTDVKNPCCETWSNGTSGCIPLKTPCHEINKNFFWDAFHLTEHVCSVIATRCFDDPLVCSPTIRQLVQM